MTAMALALYDIGLVVVGLSILGVALLPRVFSDRPVTVPMAYLGLGVVVFAIPTGLPTPDPLEYPDLATRLTELGVIVALMGVGLKLDRKPGLRRWRTTWRLLVVAMPLSIAGAALIGWTATGLLVPEAVLLGAVIAPTDPVLASEVQVEPPGTGDEGESLEGVEGGRDEVRFALSSEAGLNDGLAFPFTYLAVAMALVGVSPANWVGEWLLVDVVYRILVGTAAGLMIGRLLAWLIFASAPETHLAQSMKGLEALAGVFLAYGLTEVIGGYGFIAVFVAATVIRDQERSHDYHRPLHDVAEKAEQLMMAGIMVLFGGALVGGLLAPLTLPVLVGGLAIVLVVRPLAAGAAFVGFDRPLIERATTAFFGIRGIGSFFYLSYALAAAPFREADLLWALVGFVVLFSIVLHGITANPVIEYVERELSFDSS